MDNHHQKKGTKRGAESQEQSQLPEDTLWEVLKRLPIKNLFRCMCVSKLWRSIILNPGFNEIYRRWQDHRYILIRDHRCDGYLRLYSYSKLVAGERINLLSVRGVEGFTQIVNGFICIDFMYTGRVSLFNIWRGEITQLPDPIPIENEEEHTYHLGFESVSGVYKLLKITQDSSYGIKDSKRFQILTLCNSSSSRRDMSWRMLPADCLDSVVLGSKCKYMYKGNCGKEEKFVLIECPPDHSSNSVFSATNFHFREKFTLLLTNSDDANKLVIYTLEDIKGHVWMKHVFMLPYGCGPYDFSRGRFGLLRNVLPIGNLPTGELIFANLHRNWLDPCTEVYAYNYKNGLFVSCVLEKFPILKNPFESLPLAVSCVQPQWSDYALRDLSNMWGGRPGLASFISNSIFTITPGSVYRL